VPFILKSKALEEEPKALPQATIIITKKKGEKYDKYI